MVLAMRITGGIAGGLPLKVPPGPAVRPATDRTREAVFSSLADKVVSSRVLDLFAGCGSYGLEAASRGAEEVLFVEKHAPTAAVLEQNLRSVMRNLAAADRHPKLQVLRRDALRFRSATTFPLLFMDPPYALVRERSFALLDLAAALPVADLSPLLLLEAPADLEITHPCWQLRRRFGGRKSGDPAVHLLERAPV